VTLAVELFQQGQGQGHCPAGFSLDALQRHSLLVAETASRCFSDKQAQEDAFAVGLLHDIGKLLIASELPQHMEKVLQEMKSASCSMNVAEETVWPSTLCVAVHPATTPRRWRRLLQFVVLVRGGKKFGNCRLRVSAKE